MKIKTLTEIQIEYMKKPNNKTYVSVEDLEHWLNDWFNGQDGTGVILSELGRLKNEQN